MAGFELRSLDVMFDGGNTRPVAWRGARHNLNRNLGMIRHAGPAGRELRRWLPWRDLATHWSIYDQTTLWEQAWVTRWIRVEYAGHGEIVEMGTLVGASTSAIGRGLRRTKHRRARVVVYDAFDWRYVEPDGPLAVLRDQGLSFREIYDQRTRSSRPRNLTVNMGDIRHMGWEQQPIEFLFVDIAKTWDIWNHVRATWLPALVVNGVIAQQDWAHSLGPWLHLWHHRWRDHFEPLGHVLRGYTVPFRLTSALPADAFAPEGPEDYSAAEANAAFTWAAGLLDLDKRHEVESARAVYAAITTNARRAAEAPPTDQAHDPGGVDAAR